ncbi:MAG: alcohol dehydrogenase catalytic domain-containing protein [Firmicutes bacterium]|nr:alcohol dehydrogenase catalytic domain-containing protein [Bacillota bacterium]
MSNKGYMKAMVWEGPYQLSLKKVEKPLPAAREVLIRTKVVGICGSDLEIFEGRFKQSLPPLIIGHEGGGIVEETGPGVTSVRQGDRVIVECLLYCGECINCRRGMYNLCVKHGVMGMIGHDGEYAEYFVAPERNVYRLPENITWPEAGLIDTLAGPVAGIEKTNLHLGSTVAVYGPGPAGLFFCKLAKLRGARKVYLIGTRESRLAFGRQYGADVILNVNGDNVEEYILNDTGGYGVDLVIEAAGSHHALNSAFKVIRKGGEILVYGVFGGGPVPIDIQPIQLNELVIKGLNGSPFKYPDTIQLISSGTINVKPLISHTFRLEDLPDLFKSGFISSRKENYMKGVVVFD